MSDTSDATRGAELLAALDTAARVWAEARTALEHAQSRSDEAADEYARAHARYDAWAKAPLT